MLPDAARVDERRKKAEPDRDSDAPRCARSSSMLRRRESRLEAAPQPQADASGSVASPNRETEAMMDGSDAVSDWALLNLLLSTSSGATWVSFHHGGGVGMGFSQHAGLVICCDGSDAAAARIKRVLWNDPASGVMRHADAGYDIAKQCAREHGLNLGAIEL